MHSRFLRAALIAATCLVPVTALGADYARTLAFEKTIAGLSAMAGAGRPVADLQAAAEPLGLLFPQPDQAPHNYPVTRDASVTLVPVQLVLSQLALQAGASVQAALQLAQAGPNVLMLQSGVASLADFYAAAQAAGVPDAIEKTADGYIAHMPLSVWDGAALYLKPGDRLLLDRTSGAFLIAAGRLIADKAEIRGTGAENPRVKDYNPFVLVSTTGNATIEDSQFADLGGAAPLGGLTIMQGGFYRSDRPSVVRHSRFDNLASLGMGGAGSVLVDANIITHPRGPGILVSGGRSIRLTGNVIVADGVSHGIKISSGATRVEVTGNMIIDAGLNGVFAEKGAAEVKISDNLVAGARRSGISVASADCIEVTGNLLIGNSQSGLAVRDSAGVSVRHNRLIANNNAAISITHQPDYGLVDIASNELDGNHVGVKGSATARLRFASNDFSGQAPRLLDGELVQFTSQFFDLGDGETIINGLQLKGVPARVPGGGWRPTSCGFEGED